MKNICVRSDFSCAFDNLDNLIQELSSLGSDYACDPYYSKVVDNLNMAAHLVYVSSRLFDEMIGHPEEEK